MQYRHTQHAPLCLLLYGLAIAFGVVAWFAREESTLAVIFLLSGIVLLVLAASFHHLTVVDLGDQLRIGFGPLPLFRRHIPYNQIKAVDLGRTIWLDGWGVHVSARGGWVWNLWGWDCVVLQLSNGVLRVGSDDAPRLAAFIKQKIASQG